MKCELKMGRRKRRRGGRRRRRRRRKQKKSTIPPRVSEEFPGRGHAEAAGPLALCPPPPVSCFRLSCSLVGMNYEDFGIRRLGST